MMKPYRLAPDHLEQQGWQGQFGRMERWHQRALRALDPSQNRDPQKALDYIYAFCQSAYHLRDWLAKSGGATKTDLDTLIANTPALKLCRDICNGSKHLQLDPQRTKTDHIGLMREYVPSNRDNEATSTPRLFVFEGQDGSVDLHDITELMSECVQAWRTLCVSPSPET